MRTLPVASALLLAVACNLFAQARSAATTPDATVTYVYVGENTNPQRISAFAVGTDGLVHPVSGSPFPGAAQLLTTGSGSNYVFGTDYTNIVSYARMAGGALQVSSTTNGITQNGSYTWGLTLDPGGSFLYAGEFAANQDNAYAGFSVGDNGALLFDANTPSGPSYGSLLQFTGDNSLAYGVGCNSSNWDVFGFTRDAEGVLTPFNPGDTLPTGPTTQRVCPGLAALSARGYLAVSYSVVAGLSGRPSIAIYRIMPSGELQFLSSTLLTNFHSLKGLRFDPTGNYLAVAGQGIQTFKLSADGALTSLGSFADGSVGFLDVQWDGAGHVYALGSGAFYVFNAHNGVLSPAGSPIPVTQAGSFAVLSAPAE